MGIGNPPWDHLGFFIRTGIGRDHVVSKYWSRENISIRHLKNQFLTGVTAIFSALSNNYRQYGGE